MKGHVYRRCRKPLRPDCERGRCSHSWAFTFSVGHDATTGKRRQGTGGGYASKREADAALRQAIANADAGLPITKRDRVADERLAAAAAASRPTLAEFLEQWLARGIGSHGEPWRPNTRDGYVTNVRLHIVPRVGDVPLDEVRPRHLQQLLDDLGSPDPDTGATRTKATVARVRATLTGAMLDAQRRELIPSNPAAHLRILTGAPSRSTYTAWTPQQLQRFLAAIGGHELAALFWVAAATGMRRGEVIGLRWADVDFDAATVSVRQSITQAGGELRVGAPKTKRGERVVPIDARSMEILRRHRVAQAHSRLAVGAAWTDLDLVFTRADGTPVRPDDVTRRFAQLVRSAGLPIIRLHDLRHTHASHALAAGVPVKVVSDRLGHSSTIITENIYQHVMPKVAADAAELIASLTAGAPLAIPLANASGDVD